MRLRQQSFPNQSRGAVLFVALILLIVLSLLAVTAAQVTVLQERMSGNFRAAQRAFERTEGRMVESRSTISNPLIAYDTVDTNTLPLAANNTSPWATRLGDGNDWSEIRIRACGGACPQRIGSATGSIPLVRFYILTSQEKDPGSTTDTAAWSAIQTIQVY